MNPSSDLQQLTDQLSAMSPAAEATPRDAAAQIRDIEHRSAMLSTRRRWLAVSAVVGALALFAGLSWPNRGDVIAQPATTVGGALSGASIGHVSHAPAGNVVSHTNDSSTPSFVDLGKHVGRVLARPNARFQYDPIKRELTLSRGRIVVRVHTRGTPFRVVTVQHTVVAAGALFAVDAHGSVRVWTGSIQFVDKDRRVRGDGDYSDLSIEDRARLAIATRSVLPPAVATRFSAPPKKRRTASLTPNPTLPPKRERAAPKGERAASPSMLLLQAQRLLHSKRPAQALAAVASYRKAFPSDALAEEASLLAIRALVALKRRGELLREARVFLKTYPASSRAAEVRALLQ